jgi:hypothetical protein
MYTAKKRISTNTSFHEESGIFFEGFVVDASYIKKKRKKNKEMNQDQNRHIKQPPASLFP